MTFVRWEPFREMDDVFARCNLLLGAPLARLASGSTEQKATTDWTPAANISETDGEYLIKAELPEVSKDDVKVTVDDGVITISGERRNELEQKDEKLHRIEGLYGSFSRRFRLPDDADIGGIRAESRNGVLKVRVPKQAAARPRTVEVQVN